jgi:hypothetical protein
MAAPRLIKTDDLSRPIRRDDLHELTVALAIELFGLKGGVPPMWAIACDNRLYWVETPWENDREKRASFAGIADSMKTFRAHAYSSIVEAWATVVPKDRPELLDVAPSDRDPKERDDILLISTFDRDGAFKVTRFLVTVRKRGPNLLGPRDDETFADQDVMQGRMWNLLRQG